MKIYIGKGLDMSNEGRFPDMVSCECGSTAKHAFTTVEQAPEIADLEYKRGHRGWPGTDSKCAFAVYICPGCGKGKVEWDHE